ncbi:MAG: L-methionine/branched-chain amino acid transporter, partial [Litorivicinus sp.]
MPRSTPKIGLLGALVMLATSLLGSSVFVVPVLGVQLAGSLSLWSWLVLMVFMLPMALVFGRLGRAFPHAGGVSHWASRAFGERLEWVSALLLVSVIPVGLPAALLLTMVFVNYAFALSGWASLLAQFAVLGAVYGLNRAGVRASAQVQALIIAGTLVFIAVLAWHAPVTLMSLTPQAPVASDGAVIAGAAGLMLWCFLGLEIVANLAEDFRNPTRDIPLSVVGGVSLAGAVYYLCASTVLAAGFASVTPDALLVLAADRLGSAGVYLLALFGFLACFASVNTYLNGFSRQIWSLAREDKLPAWFALRDAAKRHDVVAEAR